VTLSKALFFAAGYFFGARAGRERYAQILDAAARASERLDELSARGAARDSNSGRGRERERDRDRFRTTGRPV
jgi:hypothetical protein